MPRTATLLTLSIAITLAAPVRASSEPSDQYATEQAPPGTTEREVLGWTDDGQLIVRRTSRGERMVSGRSKDFYFELTELWGADGGDLRETYRHGELSGAAHPAWEEATPADDAGAALAEKTRETPVRQWHSPDGRVALTTVARTTTERREETRRGTLFRCVHHQRLIVAARGWKRVGMLEEWTEKGDWSMRKSGVSCPQATVEVVWHPDGSYWALVREVTESGSQVRPPQVVGGRIRDEALPSEPSTVRRKQPLALWVRKLPGGDLEAGYRALHTGRLDRAKTKFEAVLERDSERAAELSERGRKIAERARGFAVAGLARIAARQGDRETVEAQLEAMKKILDSPFWETAVAAGCYRRLGDMEKSDLELGRAFEHADSPLSYVRLGELFRYYDLAVANRALTEALKLESTPGRRKYAYELLIEGLIDTGRYEKAEVLFDEVSSLPPNLEVQRLRATFERAAPGEVDPEKMANRAASLLADHPTVCAGYLLYGRLLIRQRRLSEARRQFQVARRCKPAEPVSAFYLGAIALRTGDWSETERLLRRYLARAAARRGDPMRERRRRLAESYLERIAHEGAVLTAVECRPHPLSGTLCRGVVENTADAAIAEVVARAVRRGEKTDDVLVSTTISTIAPGASRTIGLRLKNADPGDVVIEAGRSDEERALNRLDPYLF